MRKMMISPCSKENIYTLCDPDLPSETEFEAIVLRAFGCIYQQYQCVIFSGRFQYEGDYRKPDFAMVARDRSHWFVVEVELVSHSLEGHVLPQLQAFRYGDPQGECSGILSRELGIAHGEARTLIERVPRGVVVVANRMRVDWENAVRAHQGQLLVVTRFLGENGREAFEVAGSLIAIKESLGFGIYSAQDGIIRFASSINLPAGYVQMEMMDGIASLWRVIRDEQFTWIIKDSGRLDLKDGIYIQVIRTIDGRITLKI